MYMEMIAGHSSPALAHIIKKKMLDSDADYEKIRKYQFILTAKGRQQRRLMIRRKV